jgi:hypothetical protein
MYDGKLNNTWIISDKPYIVQQRGMLVCERDSNIECWNHVHHMRKLGECREADVREYRNGEWLRTDDPFERIERNLAHR